MKARRFLAWVVAAVMLLTSLVLPASLGGVREAEALSLEAQDAPALAPAKSPIAKDDPDETETSGWCGENLYWQFNPYTGELVITGSGSMWGEDENNPWLENGFADQILSVSLSKGITDIGYYSFYNCSALQQITLPSSVKYIVDYAFAGCASLRSITLPKSLTNIYYNAFEGCSALTDVYYQGKAEDGAKIVIMNSYGNKALINATWHYAKTAAAMAIKTDPKNVKVDEGKTAVFKVKAVGAKVLKWQYQEPNSSYWYDWGVTGESISVQGTTLFDGYRFRVAAINNSGTPVYSKAATLTVKPVKLAIKSQPKSIIKVDEGKNFTVKVGAVGATHYHWWIKWADEDDWWDFEGSDTLTYYCSYPEWYDGMLFYCVVSNDRGDEICSNTAMSSVNIKITKKPKNVKVYEGEYAEFTVEGTGYTGVQWQYQWPGSKYWYNMGGGTDETCTLRGWSDYNGLKLRCMLYNNTSAPKYTSAVKLTVTQSPNPSGANRALLVGENWYDDSPLYGCMNDMYAMEGMLKGLSNKFSTKILPNSSWSQIISGIRTAFKGTNSNSVSLFYYSGHGLSYSSNSYLHGALCSIDDDYITFSELASELSQVKGKVIVILDSCFSGASIDKAAGSSVDMDAFLKEYNQAAINAFSGYYMEEDGSATKEKTTKSGELAQGKFIVITASSKTETSHDYYYDDSGYRQGQFTAALIQGMGCSYPKGAYTGYTPADYNGNKQITLGEIWDYAYYTALAWDDSQHAQYYGNLNTVLFRRK